MKQLTTTKHIIFVILLLVIILSLFRGNIVEGYRRHRRPTKCEQIGTPGDCSAYNNNGCWWYDNGCHCRNGKDKGKDKPCILPK